MSASQNQICPSVKYLWQCNDRKARVQWVVRALEDGRTLNDPFLYLNTLEEPMVLIDGARTSIARVIRIETHAFDACGVRHTVAAWRKAPRLP